MSPATPVETVVYVNPRAGGGRAGAVWQAVREAVPELAAARLATGDDRDGATAALDAALAAGARRVVAFGGDGTLNLVVGRVLAAGLGERVDIGLVPAGTGSDVARLVGIPSRPLAAARRLEIAYPRPLDAVEVRSGGELRWSVNVASAGLSGTVDLAVNALPRKTPRAYYAATLRALAAYRPVACRVEVDGDLLHDGPLYLAAVATGRTFGGNMRVAPEAVPDDGLADVVVIPQLPPLTLLWRLPVFLAGRHLGKPYVRYRRGRRIRLVPGPDLPPYDLDGETLVATAPAELVVHRRAWRLLV